MAVLPKVIYVKWGGGDGDPPYMTAELTFKALAEASPVRFGVYLLKEELDVRSVEEVRRKGTKRWFR